MLLPGPIRRQGRRGVAAVELAFVLPFLMVLLLGVWEVGRLIDVQQIVSNAAREGGRQASTGRLTNAQVQTVVINYLRNAGLPTQNVTVTVSNATSPGTDAKDAAQLDELHVRVTLPTRDIRWVLLSTFVPDGSTLTGQAVWFSMRNKDYPSPSDPPIDY